jgi:SNF2-related domain
MRDPLAFFSIFDNQTSSSNASYSKQFFGKAANAATGSNSKNKTKMALPEAAFSLLEWAQHGQPLEDVIENYENNHNNNSNNNNSDTEEEEEMLVSDDEAKDTTAEQEEEEMPDWAQEVVNRKPNEWEDDESDTPEGLKVELRPYQKQALHWMTKREAEASDHWKRDQLELLKELAQIARPNQSSQGDSSLGSSSPIFCDCGPVLVDRKSYTAPSVGDLPNAHYGDNGMESLACTLSPEGDTHPLWEQRYLCNATQTQAIRFFVQPFFQTATAIPPPAPAPCRGGILADSMGLVSTFIQ